MLERFFAGDRPPRPIGLTILVVLFVIYCVLMILVAADIEAVSRFIGTAELVGAKVSRTGIFIVASLLALGALLAALGLWLGLRWGWWLAGGYCLYSALRHATVLFVLTDLAALFGRDHQAAEIFVASQLGRAVGYFLLVVYLYKPSVIDFMDLHLLKRGRSFFILLASAGALVGLHAVLMVR